MLISLVGLSGSGKTFIANLLCHYNNRIVHLDIDKIGHKATNDKLVIQKLILAFGPSILENGQINRKKLADVVFSSKEAMDILNELTWGYMEKKIDEFIDLNKDKIIILDWLLLVKTKYFKQSDLRILVTAPQSIRMKRAISRDGITEEKFLLRDSNAPQINESDFEHIINNVDKEKTKKKVGWLYDESIIHW